MTKRSNRLPAVPLSACTSGGAGNSDPIDVEIPFSAATGSLSSRAIHLCRKEPQRH